MRDGFDKLKKGGVSSLEHSMTVRSDERYRIGGIVKVEAFEDTVVVGR